MCSLIVLSMDLFIIRLLKILHVFVETDDRHFDFEIRFEKFLPDGNFGLFLYEDSHAVHGFEKIIRGYRM